MYFAALLIAVAAVYIILSRTYAKHTFDGVAYSATLSASEVFEDEDVFLYEEIENNKNLPLPCVRVDTELPDGLKFRLHGKEPAPVRTEKPKKKRGVVASRSKSAEPETLNGGEYMKSYVQSIFVLHSRRAIKRRWRITCLRRGLYSMQSAVLVATDLLGTNTQSKRIEIEPGKRNSVTVLPKTIELDSEFPSSYHFNGDRTVTRGLLSDPLRIAGSREYTPLDPMSKINWLSTAAHGKLMVNVEEYAERRRFGLVLNMQSRGREHDPHTPSDTSTVEMCITVCASILDMISYENIPVRIYCNTQPDAVIDYTDGTGEDISSDIAYRIGSGEDDVLLRTRLFNGREDMLDSLRLLAVLPMKISCPADKMLDAICAEPDFFSDGGNLVVISSYIDERMINFHRVMEKQGINVIYFITSANQNAAVVPDDIDVRFRTFR